MTEPFMEDTMEADACRLFDDGVIVGTFTTIEELCEIGADIPRSACIKWKEAFQQWYNIRWYERPSCPPRLKDFLAQGNDDDHE